MILIYVNKILKQICRLVICFFDKVTTTYLFKANNITYTNFKTTGIPYVMVAVKGQFVLGKNFKMNNGVHGNPIGCYSKCTFFVDRSAKLVIGDNVGISQTAIICHSQIIIGDNVKIGGGVKIYDTDFHSLDAKIRGTKEDVNNKKSAPVFIKSNAFVGAYTIVLKGVTIGENSIIGAGSVVTKSVPSNQIWAGNPAKYIKEV